MRIKLKTTTQNKLGLNGKIEKKTSIKGLTKKLEIKRIKIKLKSIIYYKLELKD
jgi:hypothetical protein